MSTFIIIAGPEILVVAYMVSQITISKLDKSKNDVTGQSFPAKLLEKLIAQSLMVTTIKSPSFQNVSLAFRKTIQLNAVVS